MPLVERATGRPIPRLIWPLTLVAIGATAMLALSSGFDVRLGDAIIIAAAGVRAIQIVAFGYRSDGQPINALRVTVIEMWVVAACGLVLARLTPDNPTRQLGEISGHSWLLLGYLAIVATAFAFVMQLYAARSTSPTRVGVILSTEPVFAALSAVLFAGEGITPVQAAGGVLLVVAVIAGRLVISTPTAVRAGAQSV